MAEALLLRCEKVLVEHQEVRVLSGGDGALGVLDAKLLCAVDGIAENHFLNAHFFAERNKRLNRFVMVGRLGLLRSHARHADFHAKIRAPGLKISVGDIIAGPGHKGAGIPERFAAVHIRRALFAQQYLPELYGLPADVPAVPRRGVIRNHAKLYKAIHIIVVLDPKMGSGDLHAEAVSQLLPGHLHPVQHHPGGCVTDGVQVKIHSLLIELFEELRKFLFIQRGNSRLRNVRIGLDHGPGMELQGAVHENLQGIDLHMLRVKLIPETLQFPQAFLYLSR